MTGILWLRRDLRLNDHPALAAAVEAASDHAVLPLFVVDPTLVASAGPARLAALRDALDGVRRATDGALVVRHGSPQAVLPAVAREAGADVVHVSAETTPYGRRRDERVCSALADAGIGWVETGSPYAVTPGRVRNGSGEGYKVYTPFSRAWREHGWRRPARVPEQLRWRRTLDSDVLLPAPHDAPADLARVDEETALERWRAFLDDGLEHYADRRDRPDLDGTSQLSVHLKYGTVHPRTLLADVSDHPAGRTKGAQTFVAELAWREFYADVLFHTPGSAWADWRPDLRLRYEDPARSPAAAAAFDAWREGRTGFPFVDAGMRQLLATGWMHNRVRMITASFLVKDLHQWWVPGAKHFLAHLRDGDVASNNHGWQWVAGTGTDAAPYFRVFNPVTQGLRFDPDGEYVRRWVPELRHLPGASAHEPWKSEDRQAYPERIVDHAAQRQDALARYTTATRA